MKISSRAFWFLGAYLILAGAAGYLSNPEHAQTALKSGGFFGALCILWGFLCAAGKAWARFAGLGTMAILVAAFIWRASVGWMTVASGDQSKLFAATLITSMLIATLTAAVFVLKDRKNNQASGAAS